MAAVGRADIPVIGHVGLTPQSVHRFGGFKVQRQVERLLTDAKAVEQAGAFGVVVECVPSELAAKITESVSIPTIGIGAGPHCDGQVLVTQDMLGLTGSIRPRFVKTYADLAAEATSAVRRYIAEVQDATFPDEAHSHS